MNEGPVDSGGQFYDSLCGYSIGPLIGDVASIIPGLSFLAGVMPGSWDLQTSKIQRSLPLGSEDHPKVCYFLIFSGCILTFVSHICHPLARPPSATSRGYGKHRSQGRWGEVERLSIDSCKICLIQKQFFPLSLTNRK